MLTAEKGAEITELAACRLIMLRQYMKYEFTRLDTDAALAAGRWQLASLSARACLGFALDVMAASVGLHPRDEIHRRQTIEWLFERRPSSRRQLRALLSREVTRESTGAFIADCWRAIDQIIRIRRFNIKPYFGGTAQDRDAHVAIRKCWMQIADNTNVGITRSRNALAQPLLTSRARRRPHA